MSSLTSKRKLTVLGDRVVLTPACLHSILLSGYYMH